MSIAELFSLSLCVWISGQSPLETCTWEWFLQSLMLHLLRMSPFKRMIPPDRRLKGAVLQVQSNSLHSLRTGSGETWHRHRSAVGMVKCQPLFDDEAGNQLGPNTADDGSSTTLKPPASPLRSRGDRIREVGR